jgi:hypothetical protein
MDPGLRPFTRRVRVAWSLSVDEWRISKRFTLEQFSEDLAYVLLEMAAWLGMVDLTELTQLLAKFNDELLRCFLDLVPWYQSLQSRGSGLSLRNSGFNL